jgi:hypothetical protein
MRGLKAAALLLAAGSAAPAAAAVDISFSQPENFTDADLGRSYGTAARDDTMRGIEQFLQGLGERWLQPGRTLRVEVLDIDLAGRYEPWRALGANVRAMREVAWPRITLRYALEENGQVVDTAEEDVTDIGYLLRPNARLSHDPLRYEKAMLDDWFRARFVETPAGDG